MKKDSRARRRGGSESDEIASFTLVALSSYLPYTHLSAARPRAAEGEMIFFSSPFFILFHFYELRREERGRGGG